MVDELPTLKDSSYYDRSKDMWKIFITNHIVAPPPYTVSKKILKIIRSKKPKLHYKSGNFLPGCCPSVIKSGPSPKGFYGSPGEGFRGIIIVILLEQVVPRLPVKIPQNPCSPDGISIEEY